MFLQLHNGPRTDIDPRVWDADRVTRQLLLIAQDGGAGANFLQLMLGKHRGFYQQFQRHIPLNNEYISSMPLHDAEHVMQKATFDYVNGHCGKAEAHSVIMAKMLDVLREDPDSDFNQWDRITAQTHCPNYHLQHLLWPKQQLLSIVPRGNNDHAFYRTLDVIKQWEHPLEKVNEIVFPLRDLEMDTKETRARCEELFDRGELKTLGDMWLLLDIYESRWHYLETEFADAHNSMHLYIDKPVCDCYSIMYDDFFVKRMKGSYYALCDWLKIHPRIAIYNDMIDEYYDQNMLLVEAHQEIYDWFLVRMEQQRSKETYHTDYTEQKVVTLEFDPQIMYKKYDKIN